MLDPTKNDTPHPRAEEKPQQDDRRGKIMFRVKPARDAQRVQMKPCAHQDPGNTQETEPDPPLSV